MKQAKRNSFLLVVAAVAILGFSNCNQSKVDEEKLTALYVENLIIEETYLSKPEELQKQKEILFKKYNYSSEKFQKDLALLGTNKETWERFFTNSKLKLDEFRKNGVIK